MQGALHGVSLQHATAYCTHQPCVNCSKLLISAGVIEDRLRRGLSRRGRESASGRGGRGARAVRDPGGSARLSPHHISPGVLYAAAFVIAVLVTCAGDAVDRSARDASRNRRRGRPRTAHARDSETTDRRHCRLLRFCVRALHRSGALASLAVRLACLRPINSTRFTSSSDCCFGSLLILGVGIWDDVMQMRPRNKLVAQIVVALISMLYGFVIPGITVPFDHNPGTNWIDFPSWIGVPLTLLWYVGMMNAINFLDGLDGLLTGVAAISSLFLFVISVVHGNPVVALVVAALTGAALGFLPYNFNPAQNHPGRCGLALHRIRLCHGFDHRREQDRHRHQRRRAAARARAARARHGSRDRAPSPERQAHHRSRPRTFPSPAHLSLRAERATSRLVALCGLLRARRRRVGASAASLRTSFVTRRSIER